MSKLPALDGGELTELIEIWRPTLVNDGEGGKTQTWARIATPWAEVIGIDGREAVVAQAFQGVSYYRIRIRFRTDRPKASDQIRWAGDNINIRSCADPNGDREQLLILGDTASTIPTA